MRELRRFVERRGKAARERAWRSLDALVQFGQERFEAALELHARKDEMDTNETDETDDASLETTCPEEVMA